MPDANEMAFSILQTITGEKKPPPVEPTKNPNAVALGRLGGAKGGKARAARLSKKERSKAATKAAQARWAKKS